MSKSPDIGFIPSDIDGDSRNSRRERLKPRRRKITMNKIKSFIGLALCALALTAFTGCKTVNGTQVADIDRIARVTKEAATIGTQEVLKRRPEWMVDFRLAHDQLAALEKADSISVADILKIIDWLPIKELKSDNARLAVTGARLLISGIDLPEVSADKLAQIRPIVTALREGLEAGGVQ